MEQLSAAPHSTMTDKPSLPALERLVVDHLHAEALRMALSILQAIDGRNGGLDGVLVDTTYPGGSAEDTALIFATRFAAAFGRLLTEPDLNLTVDQYEPLLTYHRWIGLIFSLSGFRTSDNFLSLVAKDVSNDQLTFRGANILRLLVLLTMNSFINVDFDKFWRANRIASAVAFLNYISSRYVFLRRAFEFRERLLEWIPNRLGEVKLGTVTLARLPEFYMHCSYALTAKKHDIKRPLMEQMRRACLEEGAVEATTSILPDRGDRATIVVVGEQFFKGHATFRCFAPAVKSLRGHFNVVGVIYPNPTETLIAEFFDESIVFPTDNFVASVRTVAAEIVARKPALIFYLGVGFMTHVIALASLRLAPIQCASIGHNASTMSPMIDYFILPEDWVASRECFSETVVGLPKASMPFSPRLVPKVRKQPPNGKIRVAICASTMKLNPILFDAIARVAAGTEAHVEFHFFASFGFGLAYFELTRIVRARIPRATVHPHSTYERYMELLAQCDFFLSPFPHGGMTSIMDTFQLGIPGVCLDGSEPHAHADAAIFSRINLPTALITKSVDQYVTAAIRLANDKAWRRRCTDIVRRADLDEAFFGGDARLFCKAIEDLIWPPAKKASHGSHHSASRRGGRDSSKA